MKNFPQHYIVAIVLFVLAGMVGGGLWFWTGGQLAQTLDRKSQLETQLQAVSTRGIFPSRSNLENLESQTTAILDRIQPVLASLQETSKLFDPVRGEANDSGEFSGLSPDSWKKMLGEKRDSLLELAASREIELPEGFYLGFSAYRALNPPEAATYELGIQLESLHHLTEILLQAGVSSVEEINRVMVEDTRAAGGSEGLQAELVQGPADLYTIYPFELSFTGSPRSLIESVNKMAESPYFFIIRFVDIENEKTSVPRRSEVLSQSNSAQIQQLIVPVVGQESIRVVIRVDLVLWKLQDSGAEKKEAS